MTWMLTATGRTVDLRFVAQDAIELEDIAHHLAQLNRFTGACRRPYSVAEHSLLVLHLVEKAGAVSPSVLMAALMHDAHEAYTADISSPMKDVLGEPWKTEESRVEYAVLNRFNLLTARSAARDLIRWADLTALSTERASLMPPNGAQWQVTSSHPPVDWDFEARAGFTWSDWRQCFIDRFEELQFARSQQQAEGGKA